MSLRAEKLISNSKQGRSSSSQSDQTTSPLRQFISPEPANNKQETSQTVTPEPTKDTRSQKESKKDEQGKERIEEVKKTKEEMERRQEPEGRQADTTVTEQNRREVRILWEISVLYKEVQL